jgi:hypothetical protein
MRKLWMVISECHKKLFQVEAGNIFTNFKLGTIKGLYDYIFATYILIIVF